MKTLTIRTDAEVEQALESLTRDGQSRSEATRAAILAAERAHRRALLRAEAEQLRNDPDDVSSSGSLRSCSASARRSARRCARSAARIAALVASDRDCPSRVRDSRACSTSASVRIVSVFIQQIVIHHPILCPHVLSYLIPADAPPVPALTSLCAQRTCWPHGTPESVSRDAVAAVPQRSTATPPPRSTIHPGCVP